MPNTGSRSHDFAVLDLHRKKNVAFSSDMKLLRAGPYLTWITCKSGLFCCNLNHSTSFRTNCPEELCRLGPYILQHQVVDEFFQLMDLGTSFFRASHSPSMIWVLASVVGPIWFLAFCLDVQTLLLGDSPTHSLPTHTSHTKPNSAWGLQVAFRIWENGGSSRTILRGCISDGGWQLAVSPVHVLIPLKWHNDYNGTGPMIHLEFDIIVLIWVQIH